MEKIKKIIKQAVVLEKDGDKQKITPNLDVSYNIKVLLKNDAYNMGLFDYFEEEMGDTGLTGDIEDTGVVDE